MARHDVTAVPVARLAEVVGATLTGDVSVLVTGLTQDSRTVAPGDMYCAVRGETHDGRDFVPDAVASGAVAVMTDDPGLDVTGAVKVLVHDVRAALGPVAAEAFGRPAERLTMVGVTGTNGKTSVAWMIGAVMRAAGRRVEVRGTLSGERTTPEAIDMHAALASAVESGTDTVVMEVSSHALALHRVDGIVFDVAVFTNLGRDHLDFHVTSEAYFAAKAALFEPTHSRTGVANADDVHGRLLVDAHPGRVSGFAAADASDVESGFDRTSFTWRSLRVGVPMGGNFTLMNAIAAASAAERLGIDTATVARGLAGMDPVPGRFEPVDNDLGIGIIVDYAHTPDGVRAVLGSARPLAAGRVIVVLGCGGDRDSGKRPEMGRAAAECADVVVVTSDNPRSEDPMRIIGAIVDGMGDRAGAAIVEPDRRAAIASAISIAERGDIVVIAGKGHESTQEVSGVFLPFSDTEAARVAAGREEGDRA